MFRKMHKKIIALLSDDLLSLLLLGLVPLSGACEALGGLAVSRLPDLDTILPARTRSLLLVFHLSPAPPSPSPHPHSLFASISFTLHFLTTFVLFNPRNKLTTIEPPGSAHSSTAP